MRAYLDQLQRRYERYLRWDSTAATVLQAQGSPSVHPEVLRYTHRTSLQAFERQQTPSASGSPGHLDNGRFAAHFRSLAQSDAPVDRYSVSSHPLLSGLPKISAEDDAGLRRPPSATELWNVLKRMKNGSAPGPDGLPAEFYRTFWHILAKAFDRVEHQYLLGVLDGFGFSSESAQLFAALYSDLRSDLFLNGSLVARFPLRALPGWSRQAPQHKRTCSTWVR
ncbi:uncharacterized protein ISCGN_017660 [Ixodes scapularis]